MDVFKLPYVGEVEHEHSQRHQLVEMVVLGFAGFLIPFAFGHPQMLIGSVVNAFLIRSALTLPSKKLLPVVFAPALGVLARGILFGPFTIFLAYMTPFIWVGNAILVCAFKAKIKHRLNYGLTLLAGSLAKAGFLYATAFLLYSANLVPEVFLTAMGAMQLTTAVAGGTIVYLFRRR